jgi:deoxyribose-phosphate aldolase
MNTLKEILKAHNYQLSDEKIAFELDGAISLGAKSNNNKESLLLIHSFIDHTSLKTTDNEASILKFLDRLKTNLNKFEINNVAAVCVFPKYIELCREDLKDYPIKIACVAGGFPYVQTFKEVRELECKMAVKSSCDEIDILIPVGEAVLDDFTSLRNDLKRMRKICKGKTLKVILETGELKSMETIFAVSMIAMEEGADFIKTSTGKTNIGATPEAVYVMAHAVKLFHEKTGKRVGIKVAGGVSSTTTAIQYLSIIKYLLGEEYLHADYFRIGTSSLTENIQKEYIELAKQ